jgi:hypothetical protein
VDNGEAAQIARLQAEVSRLHSEVTQLRGHVSKVTGLSERVLRLEESLQAVERVERKTDALQESMDRNQEQYERDQRVQLAYSELAAAERQWSEKFGRYAEARDLAAAIIDTVGSGHISREVIVDVTERLAIRTPRYWVAQATLAVAAWLSDSQRQARDALEFALALDAGKTALFMALVLRDTDRDDILQEWLDDYLSGLDPMNLPADFQVVIDAVTGGALGRGLAPRVVRRIGGWYAQAQRRADIAADAEAEWKRRLLSLAAPAAPPSQRQGLEVLAASPQWQALAARNVANSAIEGAARHFRERFEAGADVTADIRAVLAGLLRQLAQAPDPAEEEHLRKIAECRAITESRGDVAAARARTAAEEAGRGGALNIVSMVSRAAFPVAVPGGTLPAPTVTELLAIMSSGRLIAAAAESLREELPPLRSVQVSVGGQGRQWDAAFSCASEAERSREGLGRQAQEEARRICGQIAADARRREGRLRRLATWACPAALVAAAALGGASFTPGVAPPELMVPAVILAFPAALGMNRLPKAVRRASRRAGQEQEAVRGQLDTVAGQLAGAWELDAQAATVHLPGLRDFTRGLTEEHVSAATRPARSPSLPRTREFPGWTPRPPRPCPELEAPGGLRPLEG